MCSKVAYTLYVYFCVFCILNSDLDGDNLEKVIVVIIQVNGSQDNHEDGEDGQIPEVIRENNVQNLEIN